MIDSSEDDWTSCLHTCFKLGQIRTSFKLGQIRTMIQRMKGTFRRWLRSKQTVLKSSERFNTKLTRLRAISVLYLESRAACLLRLFCASFLWLRFAAWARLIATLAEKGFLAIIIHQLRMHSLRIAGIAMISFMRVMRILHIISLHQRSQICRGTIGTL